MSIRGSISARVPAPAKRRLRRIQQSAVRAARRPAKRPLLRTALADIASSAPSPPSDGQLERLIRGWDNPAAGDVEYLRAVIELCRAARGPILECGSGLTTFLLSIYAEQPVWTLEANERWLRRVEAELSDAGLTGTTIVHAPLRDHGDFYWYELPEGLPQSFSLVVCDGPAAAGLKGGRVGLMPVLGERIESGSAIVVDRGMVHEQVVIAVWESDYGLLAEGTSTAYRVYRKP